MTYEEATDPFSSVDARAAIKELDDHGVPAGKEQAEALHFASNKDGSFSTKKLLEWLGY
jgi:hypothetical protein